MSEKIKTAKTASKAKPATATALAQGWHYGNMFIIVGGIAFLSKLIDKKNESDGKYPCRAIIEVWTIVDIRTGSTGTTYQCEREYNGKTYTVELSANK
jgi:hypothetical protein